MGPSGSTTNPYRYGAAWGYMTNPSGLLQLGARFYWPEIGRFIQQDPLGDLQNAYLYAGDNPVVSIDPAGLMSIIPPLPLLEDGVAAVDCAIRKKSQLDKKYAGTNAFKSRHGGTRDKYQHCLYACEITKKCGRFGAWFGSIAKEVQDVGTAGDCSMADIAADKKGIGIGKNRRANCEKECNKKYPDRPSPPKKRGCPPGGEDMRWPKAYETYPWL
jgi:RHS repeat-associated protein